MEFRSAVDSDHEDGRRSAVTSESGHRRLISYTVGTVIGAVAAVVALPARVLTGDPSTWRPVGYDAGAGLAIFRYFVAAPWSLSHPFHVPGVGSSTYVTATDSNAVLAVVAKLFRPLGLAPERWWGGWLAVIVVAQAVAAVYAVRGFGARQVRSAVLAAALAVLMPSFLFRTFHPALAGHFLVLLAWGLVGRVGTARSMRRWAVSAGALLIGAFLVHPYFGPIVGVLMLSGVAAGVYHRRWKLAGPVAWCVVTGIAGVLVARASGALARTIVPDPEGFVSNTATLAWPIIPQWSGWWPGRHAVLPRRSWEGLGYLGAGVLVLLVIVLVRCDRRVLLRSLRRHQIAVVAAATLAAWAVSPRVSWWGRAEFDLRALPLSRMMWVAVGLGAAAAMAFGALRAAPLNAVHPVVSGADATGNSPGLTERWASGESWRPAWVASAIVIGGLAVVGLVAPHALQSFTNLFRAPGRAVWAVVYAALIAAVVLLERSMTRRVGMAVAAVVLVLQVVDARHLLQWNERTMISDSVERRAYVDALAGIVARHDRVHLDPPLSCLAGPSSAGFRDVLMVASLSLTPVDAEYAAREPVLPCPAGLAIDPGLGTLSVFPGPGPPASIPANVVCGTVRSLTLCSAQVESSEFAAAADRAGPGPG